MIRPSAERGDVVAYDFRRPSRISPDRQRNLEASHEQLAQAIQRWLSGRLRAPFEVHLESIGQVQYRDFKASISDPGATFLYDIKGMPGQLTAVFLDPSIAFLLIERLVGGSAVTPPPERALTQLESVIMRIVTDRVTREIATVWQDHMSLDFEFSRFEIARELIEMTTRDEDVLVTTLRVEFEEVKGIMHFALPFPVLESFISPSERSRPEVSNKSPAERAVERTRAERLVRQANIAVSARLPRTKMSLERLSELKPGDFLTTTASTDEPVEILVSGTPRFHGRQGRLGPHMGIQITETIAKE